MPSGPLHPVSRYPLTSGRAFPNFHTTQSHARHIEGMGIEAALGADATWELIFELPPALPSGTPHLRLLALANATSGEAKVNPKHKSVSVEESADLAGADYAAEGTQTITWSIGDADQWKEVKVPLDADTFAAGELLMLLMVFETTNWTLAAVSTWLASIIWE